MKLAKIQFECHPKFKKMIKDEAKRRGKTIKETTIVLLSAWLKLNQ